MVKKLTSNRISPRTPRPNARRLPIMVVLALLLVMGGIATPASYAQEGTPEEIAEETAIPAEQPSPEATEEVVIPAQTEEPEPTPTIDASSSDLENGEVESTPTEGQAAETAQSAEIELDSIALSLLNEGAFGPRGSTVVFEYIVENLNDVPVIVTLELLIADPSWPVWMGDPAADATLVIEAGNVVSVPVYLQIPENVSLLARNQVTLSLVSVESVN